MLMSMEIKISKVSNVGKSRADARVYINRKEYQKFINFLKSYIKKRNDKIMHLYDKNDASVFHIDFESEYFVKSYMKLLYRFYQNCQKLLEMED